MAGNSLDKASLLIALLRASGIPAQYVSGTLNLALQQRLILSMFPAQTQLPVMSPAVRRCRTPRTPTLQSGSSGALLGGIRQRHRHAGRRRPGFRGGGDRADVHGSAIDLRGRAIESAPHGHGEGERRDHAGRIFRAHSVDQHAAGAELHFRGTGRAAADARSPGAIADRGIHSFGDDQYLHALPDCLAETTRTLATTR